MSAPLLTISRCGRLDDHVPHDWTHPSSWSMYWCTGHVFTEGGHGVPTDDWHYYPIGSPS